jgi:hypothetical protein
MTSIKKNLPFIKLLSGTENRQVDALLGTITLHQLEVLRQITRNVLEGQLVLENKSLKELRRYENLFISFADSKKKGSQKKKLCLKLKRVWPRLLKAVLSQLELLA